ncbi:MAG: PEP-CTERM sorting domain-containing protein, partial [Syntrophorhabdus sp.]
QPLLTADRGISAEAIISGFIVMFSDSKGTLVDKAPVAVAEPSTMILLGFGFLAIGLGMRKRTK